MNSKKYSICLVALFFFHGCHIGNKYPYELEEERGYYTKNPYKLETLEKLESLEKGIFIVASPKDITKLKKQLEDRIPKWSTTGTEKTPYKLWSNFFKKEILQNIIKKLEKKYDTTLLKNYYNSLGFLFQSPTQSNEKKVIDAIKNLQADATLVAAFKKCIAEKVYKPETILFTKETLEYQEFLYFILDDSNKSNTRHIKLKKRQSDLIKWEQDGYPTGEELWKNIQEQAKSSLNKSKLYGYQENQEAVKESLGLINKLRDDPYSLTYKDLLETLPHGKSKLENILDGLPEKRESKDIKLLRIYLRLVSDCL